MIAILPKLNAARRGNDRPIPSQMGVKQGCVLALTLFTLFINDLVSYVDHRESDDLSLANIRVPVLIFADNMLLLSKSPMGLQKIIDRFDSICSLRGLDTNVAKTKYMVFNPCSTMCPNPTLRWSPLDRDHFFDYFGITLTEHI